MLGSHLALGMTPAERIERIQRLEEWSKSLGQVQAGACVAFVIAVFTDQMPYALGGMVAFTVFGAGDVIMGMCKRRHRKKLERR